MHRGLSLCGVFQVLCTFGLLGGSGHALADSTGITTAPLQLAENPPIRVLVMDSTTSAGIRTAGNWELRDSSGQVRIGLVPDLETTVTVGRDGLSLITANGEQSLGAGPLSLKPTASGDEETTLLLRRVPYGVGWWWETKEDRVYEGEFQLRAAPSGKLQIVAILPLEKYLRGVVPSEIGTDSPHDALCAQAVAARSAAVLALTTKIYAGDSYDICSDVACQAFSGLNKANPASDAAIAATRGMILEYEGRAVSAYYASNCGGFSEDIRHVWSDRASDQAYWDTAQFDGDTSAGLDLTNEKDFATWIQSSPPVWCNPKFGKVPTWAAKNFRWVREFSSKEVTDWVEKKKPGLGRIREIKPLRRGLSGRMIEAEFVGENGSLTLGPELAIRQVFVPPLRSAAFVVDTTLGQDDLPSTFTIRGAGWGHGVGMCQSGAVAMARAGRKYDAILRHYFPRVQIKNVYFRR